MAQLDPVILPVAMPHSVGQVLDDITDAQVAVELQRAADAGQQFDVRNVGRTVGMILLRLAIYQPAWCAKLWDAYCGDAAASGVHPTKEEAMLAGARMARGLTQVLPIDIIVPKADAPVHTHLPEIGRGDA